MYILIYQLKQHQIQDYIKYINYNYCNINIQALHEKKKLNILIG